MDSSDAFSQLAMCCGLGSRRREFKEAQNYFYRPQSGYLTNRPASAFANPYGTAQLALPQAQPYFLVTQPVILATSSAHHQTSTNTLTLVQQAHQHPGVANIPNVSTLSILGNSGANLHQTNLQPNMLSSQYAIYSSPSHVLGGGSHTPLALQGSSANNENIYSQASITGLNRNISNQILSKPILMSTNPTHHPSLQQQRQQEALLSTGTSNTLNHNGLQQAAPISLTSDVFRQLEKVERQVDISRDLELVERLGVVIARALDPYSLMPLFSMETLRRYQERFIFNSSVIRFIEIIKKPGQTLGLYIRSVQFEDSKFGRPPRAGLVVTKIDSDSPIYNNQVLHVGDEILSVNLVDLEGMNLDDVVVIMSIPKRLVLALRVPRERMLEDGAMMYLQQHKHQQQQNQFHSHQFIDQSSAEAQLYDFTNPTKLPSVSQIRASSLRDLDEVDQPYHHRTHQLRENRQQNSNTTNSPTTATTTTSITRAPEHTSSYFSSSIDAINRELKELRRQRMALSNNESSLDGSTSGIVSAEYRENLL